MCSQLIVLFGVAQECLEVMLGYVSRCNSDGNVQERCTQSNEILILVLRKRVVLFYLCQFHMPYRFLLPYRVYFTNESFSDLNISIHFLKHSEGLIYHQQYPS